ncbi:TPA: bifunctional biotin--[acetyl-CoA-carboxylase] ligase/biotin operon repressor BirA [Morganella morganii]|nr:bifunctional biotin--[acetyl-CoA-carboxylase] ligase/biotin operon repressor BirA [Morganella morganii]
MKDYTVPLTLIGILSDGEFHSGEQLGEQLGMTRAAVNKHIRTLREMGIEMETVTGRGYRLFAPMNLLQPEVIRTLLPERNVEVLPVIGSTNQHMMDKVGELRSGDACVAEYQYAGRGRRGRQWISPFGRNLYLSLYWRLEQGPAAAIGLSLVVGIVLAETLHELGASGVKVKWPNDLYLNDKKLAGILVELQGKTGDAAHVVIGIGINLTMESNGTDQIGQQWINLQQSGIQIDRNVLSSEFIKHLTDALHLFEKSGLTPFIERWYAFDNYLNREVKLIIGEREVFGVSRGINGQGALLLDQFGEITPYIGGEISLRGVDSKNKPA